MIHVYTEKYTPRFKYIVEHIFEKILCSEVKIIREKVEADACNGPLICYSRECVMDKAFNICPHGLVFQNGVRAQDVAVTEWNDTKIFFETGDDRNDIPFDIFSASFYLISRYEEYSGETDSNGCFRKEGSIAFKNGFLDRPLVDEWAYIFEGMLVKKVGYVPSRKHDFRVHSSVSIDQLYKYRYQFLYKTFGQLFTKLFTGRWKSLKYQLRVLLYIDKDPYNCFDKILSFHNNANLTPSFFVMSKKGSGYRNIYSSLNPLRKVLRRNFTTGLHPSDKSVMDVKKLRKELIKLEKMVVKARVETNLFHELQFSLPVCYENLLKIGIVADYSMGYADATGFRASTCTPFRFYDIKHESKTKLMVHSLVFADEQLRNAGIHHEMLEAALIPIIDRIKKVNGQLCCCVSNKMFSNVGRWYKWENYFRTIYSYASKLETNSIEKARKICKL